MKTDNQKLPEGLKTQNLPKTSGDIMTEAATKEDINRLYDKLDEIIKDNTQREKSLSRIEEQLKSIPKIPGRPCDYFLNLKKDIENHIQYSQNLEKERGPLFLKVNQHLEEAEDNVKSVKQIAFGFLADLVKYGVIIILSLLIGKHL